MLTKPLLLALVAACGAAPGVTASSEPPEYQQPPEQPPEEGQHFCCESLGGDGSGNGCVTIDKSHIAACNKLLYCGGTYEKDGSKVTCIE